MKTGKNRLNGATAPILPQTTLSGVVGATFLVVFALQAAAVLA